MCFACSDPINLVITLILAAGVVNTARDWHNTLQILGVYGPVISTGLWYREFESPQVILSLLTVCCTCPYLKSC